MKRRRAFAAAVLIASLGPPLLAAGQALADEGMWPFNHLPKAELERKYGFAPSAPWLEHLQRSALRLVNGCSGSFVSPRGLILTNHHCVADCISRLSSARADHVARGYTARAPAEELVCPGAEIQLTQNSQRIARARFDVYGMNSYPDATSSPRLSFGTVRGWREPGKVWPSFTRLGGIFERATGRAPFALPQRWLDRRAQLDPNVPFNFVADNDTVGGSSGSPVVDRAGDLVGVVFDINQPSLGGSYGYDIARQRMIAVDVRAILHTLEVVYPASQLQAELSGLSLPATPAQ